MARGLLLDLTPAEVVARALSAAIVVEDREARIWYSSARGRNGGSDPEALTCASLWHDPAAANHVRATADCVGFMAWAAGFDRYQPVRAKPSYGGWMNQASILMETRRIGGMFRAIPVPELGAIAVIGDIRDAAGQRTRPGHVGIVVALDGRDVKPENVQVAHCSPSNHPRVGQGIAVTSARVAFGTRPITYVVIAEHFVPDRRPAGATVGAPDA